MKKIGNFFKCLLGLLLWTFAVVLYIPFFILFPVKVVGRKNLSKCKGKAIIASNHFSNFDVIFLVVHFFKRTFSRKLLAKRELSKSKFAGFCLAGFGAIFITRGKVDLTAVREVDKVLKQDKKLLMFPEGTRNKTGSTDMQEIKSGIIFFAKKSDAPIIPLRMERKARLFRLNKVYIGEPYKVGDNGKISTEEEVKILEEKFKNLV